MVGNQFGIGHGDLGLLHEAESTPGIAHHDLVSAETHTNTTPDYTDAQSNHNSDSDTYRNPDTSDSNADLYSYADTSDSYTNLYSDTSDSYTNLYSDSSDSNANLHPHADSNADLHSYADSDTSSGAAGMLPGILEEPPTKLDWILSKSNANERFLRSQFV